MINHYFDDFDINSFNFDTVIMSDVFEHFYEPLKILEKLRLSKVKYIYI